MRILLAILIILVPSVSLATSTRIIEADQIVQADHSRTWNMPNQSDTFVGRSTVDTLTNKVISGSNNTLSQIPVASQTFQDVFSGNGSTTAFTLSQSGGTPTASGLSCYVDGLLQEGGGSDYSYTGGTTTVTFTTAPATGQNIRCVYSKY